MGAPTKSDDDDDVWNPKGRRIRAEFKRGKLVRMVFSLPRD
jgi:hypothetical protein